MFWIYKLKDFPVTDQGRTFFLHQYIQSWMPGMSNLMFWLLWLRHFFLYPLHVTRKSPHAHNNMTTKLALTSTDYLSSLRAKSSPNFSRGHLGQITVCIMCFLYFLLSSVWKILLERETRRHRFFNFHIFKLALEFNRCLSISSPTCFFIFLKCFLSILSFLWKSQHKNCFIRQVYMNFTLPHLPPISTFTMCSFHLKIILLPSPGIWNTTVKH